MNSKRCAFLLAGLVLGGCSGGSSSGSVAGGGFETSDLQVVVLDSLGRPLVGARVWVVGLEPDTLSAAPAYDSAVAGFAGEASLSLKTSGSLGMEAWSGDTLSAFVPFGGPARTDTIRITLRRTRFVYLPCSTFALGAIQFAGSHFQRQAPPVCSDSFVVIVPGSALGARVVWNAPDAPKMQMLQYKWDSLPVWRGPSGIPPGNGSGSGSGSGNGLGTGTGSGGGSGGGTGTTEQPVPPVIPPAP